MRELENLVRRLMVLRDPRYVLSELKQRAPAAPAAPPPSALAAAAAPYPPAASVPLTYSREGAVYHSPFNSPSPLPPPTIPPPPGFRPSAAIAESAGGGGAGAPNGECTPD